MKEISITLCLVSLFYFTIVLLSYFPKQRVKSYETRIFTFLVVLTVLIILFEIASFAVVPTFRENLIPSLVVNKIYILLIFTYVLLFTRYIYYITFSNVKNKLSETIKLIMTIILPIVMGLVILFAPLYFYSTPDAAYSYGMTVDALNLFNGLNMVFWFLCFFKKDKKIEFRKYYPVIAFTILGFVTIFVKVYEPSLSLVALSVAFATIVMYHTIENPDMKLIDALNIARDQADKANEAKTEFLSSMSHEIRTPLNAVVGFSHSVLEAEIPDNIREDVKDIITASDTLLEIVNGILDISKIESGKLEIINTEYSFQKILNELVALTKVKLVDKPLEFRTVFDESIPKVLYGDSTRLKQIILNILTNAVKYTKEGYVEFKVNSIIKGDIIRLIISVEDSGFGIDKDQISKLFTKFERFDEGKHRTIEGTGLGLAITKKLVDLMRGEIVVQSIYGRGSKFTVAIDQRIVAEPTIDIESNGNKIEEFNGSGMKILVVDDNQINLKVAGRLLQNYKLEITNALSGFECLDKIKAHEKFDLILLDDMMPKMSGVITLEKLKEIEGFNIPTVALTANAITGMREKYLKEGFDDYLAKPIDRDELDRVLRKFLNKE